MDLGVNWAVADSDRRQRRCRRRLHSAGGRHRHRRDHRRASANPRRHHGRLPSGLTLGVGQIVENGTSWAALIRALSGIGNTNIIATPSIVTLDNEEAEIKIAQEVPFVTGQYTTRASTAVAASTIPFQTIQREEVGNILKITPQINEGDCGDAQDLPGSLEPRRELAAGAARPT